MKRLSWFLMAALKAMLGFRLAVPLRVQVGYVGDGRLSIWASIRCCEHDDRTGDSSVLDGKRPSDWVSLCRCFSNLIDSNLGRNHLLLRACAGFRLPEH